MDGQRLDRTVAKLAGLSRAVAKAITRNGGVAVDGEIGRPADRVPAGALLEIQLPPPQPEMGPEPVPFDVRYEDDLVAVVDKPSGVVTHPGAGVRDGTLASGLLHRWPQLEGVGDPGRWGLVHRLDRDTSGLLTVALTPSAFDYLRRELAARRIAREYDALAHGLFDLPTGTVDAPLARDPANPTRRAVSASGKGARTHYRVEAAWPSPPVTRLTVSLETGRTHQVRVHLAAIAHPIVGDRVYGHAGPPEMARLWLHARHLGFDHPESGDRVEVWAPLPDELTASLKELGDQM